VIHSRNLKIFFLVSVDRKIDGPSLLNLSNDTIRQLLYVSDKNETQNQRLIDQFKQKLYEWKIQYRVVNNDRRTE
jgi:hypothetical protein